MDAIERLAVPNGSTRRRDRRPVERILPRELIDELRGRVTGTGVDAITPKLAQAVDAELQIEVRYGVGWRRLRTFLQRLRAEVNDHAAGAPNSPTDKEKDDRRAREASAAQVIEKTFGPLGDNRPELWNKHAYLLMVGMIYERLLLDQSGIPTKDLVSLAKILLDARRKEAGCQDGSTGDAAGNPAPRKGPLPDHFADLIRHVYGANIDAPETAGLPED